MLNEIEDQEPVAPSSGIGMADIIRMLFKHKWKLVAFTVLSIGAAAALYFTHTAQYQSTSKIFVRYVEEVSNVDAGKDGSRRTSATPESAIGAEVEILQSWDLAGEVVDVITPAAITRNAPDTSRALATQMFIKNLEVSVPRGARVITVTYRHPDPEIAVKALTELVRLYREKHVEIHRATKSRETSRARRNALTAKISDLTEQIEQLKADNGISSLVDAATGLNKRSDEMRTLLATTEAELQEQIARLGELKRLGLVTEAAPVDANPGAAPAAGPPPATPSSAAARSAHLEYQSVMKRLTQLQDEQVRLMAVYNSGSPELQQNRTEIAEWDAKRAKLESEHPSLLTTGPAITPGAPLPPSIDPMVETVRLATLSSRFGFLKKRQEGMKEEFKQFSVVSKRLHELERDREMQSEGLLQFAGAFQRNEFESPLTADQYDNIVIVQGSSPPVLALSSLLKLMSGIAFGGIAFGLGLVAFLELGINRSIKRPLELETRVGIPLMCHIPQIAARKRKALPGRKKQDAQGNEVVGIEAWSNSHFIRPYAEALRDRLVLYFEQIGLTRKPKLVGVASYSRGAGVSTVASGIAAALSETGDGKVLLVDMNPSRAQVHPFFDGKPAATLTEALEVGTKMESAADNLYLATAVANNGQGVAGQLFPKRFYDMLPNFQASDFDYIIFDMPPMDESSLTLAMSGFMDKLLLIVEAEKDNRETVKRASAELIRARAKLSGVLNKTRSYGPKWLQEA